MGFYFVYLYFHIGLCEMPTNVSVVVTGMSPLSPYLNVDPRYLVQVSYSCSETKLLLIGYLEVFRL